MHEVGIISSMLKTLERVKVEEELTHIDKIVVEVGELSGVVPHYMEQCFPAAVYKTPFEDLKMELELAPGTIQCLACGKLFPFHGIQWKCPDCESEKLKPVEGTGLLIKEIHGK